MDYTLISILISSIRAMKTITIVQNTLIVSGLLMLLTGAWLRRNGSDPRGRKKMLFWCGFVLTLLGAAMTTEFGSGFLEGVMFGK